MALVTYLMFAVRHCRHEQKAETLQKVEITIADTLTLITAADVRNWINTAGIALEGTAMEKVELDRILDTIASQPAVKSIAAHTVQSGELYIEVGQRRPVVRLVSESGDDRYLSDDLHTMPVRLYAAQYLPVVSGRIEGHEKNLRFLSNLINFVESLEKDPLWRDEIVQIVVHDPAMAWTGPEIELIPRTGRFTIIFGTLDSAQEKIEKLALFYRNVLPYEGWDTYAVVDARYRDQIVCRRQR